MSKIENAAIKAEDIMNAKYGNDWKITTVSENGEEKIEVKDEYMSEYDDYYEKFFFNYEICKVKKC